jgi:hypothetical protein
MSKCAESPRNHHFTRGKEVGATQCWSDIVLFYTIQASIIMRIAHLLIPIGYENFKNLFLDIILFGSIYHARTFIYLGKRAPIYEYGLE